MASRAAVGAGFGDLLRSLRLEAGLSREALAERAGISKDAIRAYERKFVHGPRRATLALLIDALRLSGDARKEFEAAALRKIGATSSSTSAPGNNLPWRPTSFVGRQREIEDISRLLAPRQLVTITGSGGIGKTRTSLEVASQIALPPRDGIWVVDLAPISDRAFAISKVASVLGVQLPEQPDLLPALISAIKSRQLLLIIDNCEHILPTVRKLSAAILEACPQITLLATSRERLGIAGERVYRLSTLAVPAKDVDAVAAGRSFAALELFSERATEHGFVIADEYLGIAADICRRLDGIALAIELAAARVPVIGLSELRAQLAKHFKVISGSRHDLVARQRALDTMISWSHDLLDERERALFRRLAIFSSGWTLEAATHVCSDVIINEAAIFDTLFSLVEKSLVQVDLDVTPPRYSFFESTRAFAIEQLDASPEGPALSRRHALWIATFAERIYDIYGGVPRGSWAIEAAPELDNTLVALEWAFGPEGDATLAGQITSGLQGFWRTAGLANHGRRYVTASLERIVASGHPVTIARLIIAQARYIHGEERANSIKRAISLIEGTDDPRLLARCYGVLSFAFAETGNYSDALEANTAGKDLLCKAGLQRTGFYSNFLADRSQVFLIQGRLDEARAALTEALSVAIAVGDNWSISLFQGIFVEIEFIAGNTERAKVLAEEAITSARRIRDAHMEGSILDTLACCQLILGEVDAAEVSARDALDIAVVNASARNVHLAIQLLAVVAALRGQGSRAARLIGYVDAWFQRIGYQRSLSTQKSYDILMESLHEQLHEGEISALAVQGTQLTEEAAIHEALG